MRETIKKQIKKIETVIVYNDVKYLFFKRIMDIVGACFGILFFFPFALIIGILIKFEDGGAIFFSQTRIGQNGIKFTMFKFRSMNVKAESFKKALISKNEIDGKMFKIKEDPRITRVGRFIRRHSLDEIPQLFNILLGDMSLVGPRPPLEDEVVRYTELEKQRL